MNLEDLKIEDLYVQCDACEGTGRYSGPPNEQSRNNFGRHVIYENRECYECNGRGGQITRAGQVILDFLQVAKRRHLI